MDKRVLTSIVPTNADGMLLAPATTFDYWGYSDPQGDGFYTYYTSSSFNKLQMVNTDLSPSRFPSSFQAPPYIVDGVTYYPLFGHLKTVTTPSGAINWYSYREVSDNYDTVWSGTKMGNFDSLWQNKLDLQDIAKDYVIDDPDKAKWECFRISWGFDNFAVLTFYSKDKTGTNNGSSVYQMGILIFEWVGQWLPIQQVIDPNNKNIIFNPEDPVIKLSVNSWEFNQAQDYNVVEAGNGMFAVVRTGISLQTGAITLFNRDPYHPGYWQVSSFAANTTLTATSSTYQIGVSMAGALVNVTDAQAGNAYLYGWNGKKWDALTVSNPNSKSLIQCATGVIGNDVIFFYPNPTNTTLMYTLYRYDTTQAIPWVPLQSAISLPFNIYPAGLINTNTTVVAANGFMHVFANYNNVGGGVRTEIGQSFLMSWDADGVIYLQQIYINKTL